MSNTVQLPIDIEKIQSLLRHRYPFLLVDRVTELEPGKRIVATRTSPSTNPSSRAISPPPGDAGRADPGGAGADRGLLTQLQYEGNCLERVFYLVKIDNARFSRMVVPGDRLDMEVSIKRVIRNMAIYVGEARVDASWPPAPNCCAPK